MNNFLFLGLNISCVVDQVVMSSGQIMYTTYSTLTLDIKPIIPLVSTVQFYMYAIHCTLYTTYSALTLDIKPIIPLVSTLQFYMYTVKYTQIPDIQYKEQFYRHSTIINSQSTQTSLFVQLQFDKVIKIHLFMFEPIFQHCHKLGKI